ncbi:hypothetical protein, partial [Pectobacterium atrosepticum]|uniref:hypothetical protein n=1 Tax=Pectobacterium atrosepticum TaxID=29471 RepID=UPI001A92B4DC
MLILVVESDYSLNGFSNFTVCIAIRMPIHMPLFLMENNLTKISPKQNLSKKLRRPREKTASIAQKVIST